MDADAWRKKPASRSLPPPPPPHALLAIRSRSSRVADLGTGAGAAFSGPPDTPPRRSNVTVPFLWEEAPGKPKAATPPTACATAATPAAAASADPVPEGGAGRDRQDRSGHADQVGLRPLKLPPRLQRVASYAAADTRQDSSGHADQAGPLPLKLPPRLQRVASFAAADTRQGTGHVDQAGPRLQQVPPSFASAEYTPSPSPKTVLQGLYHGSAAGGGGGRSKPPKWVRSGGAALRRTPSAGMALLSRTLSKRKAPASGSSKNRGGDHERDAAGPGPDGPWFSPASSSSSSSVSTRFGGDDHRRRRPADGREASSSEDDGSPRGSVRITRLTRHRSLPSLTTSNLWASVRRCAKQMTPVLHGARSWATARYGHW